MKRFKDFLLEQGVIQKEEASAKIINEITISPYYQQRGVPNPYYTLSASLDRNIKNLLNTSDELQYLSVESDPRRRFIYKDRGGYEFKVMHKDGTDTGKFIKTTKANVETHLGMRKRKDSTASSNVNEILSVYFLKNTFRGSFNVQEFVDRVNKLALRGEGTGIFTGNDTEFLYSELSVLLDKDETMERDVTIGYYNAKAIAIDLSGVNVDRYYWTPRGKPGGINNGNPSDVMVRYKKPGDGYHSYLGYSNKITAGVDKTPKFNTGISAFIKQGGNSGHLQTITEYVDEAWNEVAGNIPDEYTNSKKALWEYPISVEPLSETASRKTFAMIAKEFLKDGLNFYKDDFYIPFRNTLIKKVGTWLENENNLSYFLSCIGVYMYGDESETPCPYKLLVGTTKGSTITEVSSNENMKLLLTNSQSGNLSNIDFIYDGVKQSFNMSFNYDKDYQVIIPVTLRTRSKGGWAGKGLFITTSGVKMK